jgi:hypothetical protein
MRKRKALFKVKVKLVEFDNSIMHLLLPLIGAYTTPTIALNSYRVLLLRFIPTDAVKNILLYSILTTLAMCNFSSSSSTTSSSS